MAILMKQVKPQPGVELMGLEKEDMSVFPGCNTTMEIPIVNGRPNIGLDGKDSKGLRDKFENHFGVKFDTPEGLNFLYNYEMTVSHDVSAYDPRNLDHAFDLHILKVNNGMGIIAVDDAAIERSPVNTFRFKLTDEMTEQTDKVNARQVKYAATTVVSTLYDSNPERLILLAKYIFPAGSGIGNNKLAAFEKISDYLEQNSKNCQSFMTVTKTDVEHINTVVLVKEAIYRNIIRQSNGQYVLYATQTPLGRNEEEVIKFCSNPNNKDIVGYGLKDDLPTSISAQLKLHDN